MPLLRDTQFILCSTKKNTLDLKTSMDKAMTDVKDAVDKSLNDLKASIDRVSSNTVGLSAKFQEFDIQFEELEIQSSSDSKEVINLKPELSAKVLRTGLHL